MPARPNRRPSSISRAWALSLEMDLLRWWRRSTADVDEERKLYEAYMAAYDAWWEAVSGRPRTTR